MDKQVWNETVQLPAALAEKLLPWYRANARDLPWRHTEDPYRIWVSEIMLQQTRVAAVLGYYARFLEAFPTVEALAEAEEERLMKLWEGLGYYSRARNLQKAARAIRDCGSFPQTVPELKKLPGIGDYTAGAIASAAFGVRAAAVDGNVLRVTARLTDSRADVAAPAQKRAVTAALEKTMPTAPAEIRIFNQAMMELGATVCGPNGPPECARCPLQTLCLGFARGTAPELPVKAAPKARRVEEHTVFLLFRDGRVALRKRPKSGLLAGLWEFPNRPGTLDEAAAASAAADWDLRVTDWLNRRTARHIFSHVEWHMTGYALRVEGTGPEELIWVDAAGLAQHSVPSAFARYYQEAAERLQKAPGR